MKKTIRLFAFSILAILFAGSCKPTANEAVTPIAVAKDTAVVPINALAVSSSATLTVAATTNRTTNPGGSFTHLIMVTNGTKPVANATVYIDDPIGLQCTWVTTNSQGVASWTRTTTSTTKRQLYTFRFYYGNNSTWSTVAVSSSTAATRLSNVKVAVNNVTALATPTMVLGNRNGTTSVNQSINNTMQVAGELGRDIAVDYLSNPANVAIASVALVSCTAGQVVPGLGQATCAASATMVASSIGSSAAKTLAKKAVTSSTNFTAAQKTQLLSLIDATSCAIGLAQLKPGQGLQGLENLATLYDVQSYAFGTLIQSGGTTKGASIPVQLTGTNTVYMISIWKR